MVCAYRFMQQNCHPQVRAAPLAHARLAAKSQSPGHGSTARPGFQAMTLGCADSQRRVASVGIEPGTSRSGCINLYGHTILLSARTAEWYVGKELCKGDTAAGASRGLLQSRCEAAALGALFTRRRASRVSRSTVTVDCHACHGGRWGLSSSPNTGDGPSASWLRAGPHRMCVGGGAHILATRRTASSPHTHIRHETSQRDRLARAGRRSV